jgi:membrane protease YdiL (CAAX protease family)
LFCLFLFILIIKRHYFLSWLKCVEFIGFKNPNISQILTGLICTVPIILFYLISFRFCLALGWSFVVPKQWLIPLIFTFFTSGIFEEAIYRGFFFHCLRENSSFLFSSFLSGLLWAFIHIGNVLLSANIFLTNSVNVTQTIYVMILAFVFAFPSAYVFEKGGNSIWGWMIVHVCIDSTIIVGFNTPKGYFSGFPTFYSWIGIILAAVVAFPVGFLLMRKKSVY